MSRSALIVDDSVTMRRMVAMTLHQAGFETIEAGDTDSALEVLKKQAFHLVITDLNMPGADGIELIRGARQLPAHRFTPILMLTTESQGSRRQEGKTAGATGWIVKPFDPEKLLEILAKVVR